MSVLLTIEGVLKNEVGDPIPEGIKLFRALADDYRIILSSEDSPKFTDHWLKSHAIIGYGEVYDDTKFFEGQNIRSRHIALAKASGPVELYIDADADFCAEALSMGIPALMFASPRFVRTTRNVKPWEDLVNEVERQKIALVEAELGSKLKRFE